MRYAPTQMIRAARCVLAMGLVAGAEICARAHEQHDVPHWQQATGWPDRIITNFGKDPCREFSVTWRTDRHVAETVCQIVEASADARFDLGGKTVAARTEHVNLETLATPHGRAARGENHGLGTVHYHSATFADLKPGRRYAFRVQGAAGKWSEWFQTKTAPASGPLEFIYLGDAQQGIRSHWSRVIRAAHEAAPHADFIVHAGDLVQEGDSDNDWAQWFAAGSYLHARIPTLPVVGNHEYMPVVDAGTGKKSRVLTPLWRAQFTLPVIAELPEEMHEAVYEVKFNSDLHMFAMNSAPSDFSLQAKWLDRQLEKTDAKWRVVTMHHPYFIPKHSNLVEDNAARIAAFTDVIRKHRVDLVIVGHIHTYLRSTSAVEAPDLGARQAMGSPQDVKTVFVISSSGPGVSQIKDAAWIRQNVGDGQPEADTPALSFDRTAGNTPMFQIIRIDGDSLVYTAHTALGDVYDRFSLKKADGRKTLTNGSEAFGETRLFENTGPFREWHDLR